MIDGIIVLSHLNMRSQQMQLTRARLKPSLTQYIALSSGDHAAIGGVDHVLQFGNTQHGLKPLVCIKTQPLSSHRTEHPK